jgi:polyhydroxybutyrate depolymerase
MKRVLRVIGAAVLVVVAIVGTAGTYFLYSPNPIEPGLSSTVRHEALKIGDRTRSFLTYIPANLPAKSPLVIVLHGSLMDGESMRRWTGYEFDRYADERHFALVYPDGYQHNWNDCRKGATFAAKLENIDDVGFLGALIARLQVEIGIDPTRVFLFGYSNGGHLAFRMAMEHADMISAIASVGASLPVPDTSSCPKAGATSRAMLINGTDDPINPFAGGSVTLFGFANRGKAVSAMQTAQTFAERNGVDSAPAATRLEPMRSDDTTWVEQSVWERNGVAVVALEAVHGGGHVVPQLAYRFPRLLGRTSSAIDAPRAALDFFGVK